jgi:hypothetical protein
MSIPTVIALVVGLAIGLSIGARYAYPLLLVGAAMGSVIKRFALPAIIILAVTGAVVGGIAALAGGNFLIAAQGTFVGGALLAFALVLLRSLYAVFNRKG